MLFVFCMITSLIAAVSAETTGANFAASFGLSGSDAQSLDESRNVGTLALVAVTIVTIMAAPASVLAASRC